MDLILKFSADEAGASAVEYALLLAFISRGHRRQCPTFGAAVANLFDHSVAVVQVAGRQRA